MSDTRPFQIAVLISGGGTTLKNLIDLRSTEGLVPQIRLVISSKPTAGGLAFAKQGHIESLVVDHRDYSSAEAISEPIFAACRRAGIDLVVMGGFLRKVEVPADFANRVINIHPSLIPAFCGRGMYGMRVHEAVIDQGAAVTGCTVHFVDNQYDHGPVIAQSSLVVGNSSPQDLQKKVFALECELYPQVLNAIARGEVSVVGDEVLVSSALPQSDG